MVGTACRDHLVRLGSEDSRDLEDQPASPVRSDPRVSRVTEELEAAAERRVTEVRVQTTEPRSDFVPARRHAKDQVEMR